MCWDTRESHIKVYLPSKIFLHRIFIRAWRNRGMDIDPAAIDGLMNAIPHYYPVLIILVSTAFLYPALGRAKIFHDANGSRLVISLALGISAAGIVQANYWNNILTVTALAISGGLISLLVWHVMGQRGKPKGEAGKKGNDAGNP